MYAELKKTFEELDVIYNRLIKLIETDNDPYFVDIVAQLGKLKSELIIYRRMTYTEEGNTDG